MMLRIDCRAVSRLISAGADAALPAADRARLQFHFMICTNCRNANAQFGFLRRAMRQLGQDDGDPPRGG